MCFKKRPPVPVPNVNRQLLSFAINNYPGSGNDLNGCINDQDDLIDKLNELGFAFAVKTFQDSEVTRANFRNTIKNYIVGMKSGDFLLIQYSGHGTQVHDPHHDEADGYDEALYLYDGAFTDDEFNEVLQLIPEGAKVVIALDSCFSGGATRLFNGDYRKAKYIPTQKIKSLKRRKKYLKSDLMKWIVFSGCGETQTSADAYINGRYNGAFTWAWLKEAKTGIINKTWNSNTKYLLNAYDFEQVCTLDGDETLQASQILT
jgi:hypothetical protein